MYLSKDKYLSVYLICINIVTNLNNEAIFPSFKFTIYNKNLRCGQCLFNTYKYVIPWVYTYWYTD